MSEISEERSVGTEDRRLWIGNLDFRITEYQLLKIVQKYGNIEKFDLLFHKSGPQAGQPRGYAFVTYLKVEDAINAKGKLHNLLVGQKRINVTWAHSMSNDEPPVKPQEKIVIPALAIAKQESKTNREFQIKAIEAKLKLMEKKSTEELRINETVSTKAPVIVQYQQKNAPIKPLSSIRTKISDLKSCKPYQKKHGNR